MRTTVKRVASAFGEWFATVADGVGSAAAGLVGMILVLGAVLLMGASCDKSIEPFRDANRGSVNSGPADTFTMPDGFSNGATKCDHGNRLYVIYKGDNKYGAIAVVPNDPTCAK